MMETQKGLYHAGCARAALRCPIWDFTETYSQGALRHSSVPEYSIQHVQFGVSPTRVEVRELQSNLWKPYRFACLQQAFTARSWPAALGAVIPFPCRRRRSYLQDGAVDPVLVSYCVRQALQYKYAGLLP